MEQQWASQFEKVFICHRCPKKYKTKNSLVRHWTYECGVIPKFQCKFCLRRYAYKKTLQHHIDTIHKEIIITSNNNNNYKNDNNNNDNMDS